MSNTRRADLTQIRRHWHSLCETIGERVSGSEAEQRAANYIERQFRRFGLTGVTQQSFEFPNYEPSRCALWIRSGRSRRRMGNVEPFMFSVNTPAGPVRGPIEYLEGGHAFHFRRNLRGRIGLIIGSMSLMDRPLMPLDSMTCERISMPSRPRICLATAPPATLPTVSRPLARPAPHQSPCSPYL